MKLPRNIDARDLISALGKYGYQPTRQTGSHIRLTTTLKGEHHITIPRHNPIQIGTLNAIVYEVAEHLGMTKKEFAQLLFK